MIRLTHCLTGVLVLIHRSVGQLFTATHGHVSSPHYVFALEDEKWIHTNLLYNFNDASLTQKAKSTSRVVLTPTDDVYIKNLGRKQRNYNFRKDLVYKLGTCSLIRFDLSDSAKKIGALRSATLRLFALDEFDNNINVNVVAGNWKEETVTWGNAPAINGPRKKKNGMTLVENSQSWYEVDITNAVKWCVKIKGQSFVTVSLSTRKGGRGKFASKEYKNGAFSPKLILEMGDVSSAPPPIPKPNPPRPTTKRPSRKPTLTNNNPSNNNNNPSNNNVSKPANHTPPKPNTPASTAAIPPTSSLTPSAKKTIDILQLKKREINEELLIYESMDGYIPSTIYNFDGMASGLITMNSKGVAGHFFYLGEDDSTNGYKYGLVNVAAFLAQAMKETIKYNVCDENNWDMFNDVYPISNACGQLGQSYQEYHCSDEEKHMECPVDPNMRMKAVTHATWWGAPGPLYCEPKSSKNDFTGFWDYQYNCDDPWADPPLTCEIYEGQKAGKYNNSIPVENLNGRTDVEGCCWWGRGVIQTTGVCNFGKLNFFLGKKAAADGRNAVYPNLDFCKDPEVICSSKEHPELKWIAGMFYWIESIQNYDVRGWNYMNELHEYVDGGIADNSFIDAVSGIVNRGCHDAPSCGTGVVDGGMERSANFQMALQVFGL